MAAFGLPTDALDGAFDHEEAHCEVWEDNWDTLMVWLSLQTQWRKEIPAMSGQMIWHGLNYPAVEATLRMMGLWKQAREIFDGLRVMEAAALPILNQPTK